MRSSAYEGSQEGDGFSDRFSLVEVIVARAQWNGAESRAAAVWLRARQGRPVLPDSRFQEDSPTGCRRACSTSRPPSHSATDGRNASLRSAMIRAAGHVLPHGSAPPSCRLGACRKKPAPTYSSRGAATDSSPGREPGGRRLASGSPGGAKEPLADGGFFRPSGAHGCTPRQPTARAVGYFLPRLRRWTCLAEVFQTGS